MNTATYTPTPTATATATSGKCRTHLREATLEERRAGQVRQIDRHLAELHRLFQEIVTGSPISTSDKTEA